MAKKNALVIKTVDLSFSGICATKKNSWGVNNCYYNRGLKLFHRSVVGLEEKACVRETIRNLA